VTVSLGKPDWLSAPASRAVLDALEAAGGPDCARFVGGCVRNALLGQPISDIDVATTLTPQAVIRALEAARVRAIPTGVDHGTVTAVFRHKPVEVTTLRRDVETDGRRAVVAFTTDWSEDAQRRDFTLNALYARRDGRIEDPTGRGVEDALAGRIVFVGDAALRLREDHLRALRFFRFLAWYGRGEPDAEAVAAIAALKDGVATLAAERVSAELLKLLAAADPAPAVRLMRRTGVFAIVLPNGADQARFEALVGVEGKLVETDGLLRLAAFLPDDPAEGAWAAERLRLSNADRDRLAAALAPAAELRPGLSGHDLRVALYRRGAQPVRDRLKLNWAAVGGAAEGWLSLIAAVDGWTAPAMPVNGADALAAGAAKGPRIGEALRAVEDWWIAGDFQAERAEALARLRELLA